MFPIELIAIINNYIDYSSIYLLNKKIYKLISNEEKMNFG